MGRNEDDSRSIRSRRRGQAELKSKVIQFSCIFCNDFFPTTNGLFDHMRSSHKNLCDIPQITADSDLLEEIAGEKEVDSGKNAPAAPVECYQEQKQVDSEEEIDSPPFERNSEGASSCCETRSATNSPSPTPPTPPNLEMEDDAGEEDSGDDEDYLRIMEPICELNCNESEAEEFQEEIKGQLTANPLQLAASPEGGFFQCSVCHKSFHLAGELARHVRSHTLNKPYQCSICGKSFTHIGSLNTHLRIHRGEKPYKCDKCEKKFTQSSSLVVHLRSHQTKKPITCQVCEKGFMNTVSLQLHMKCHEDAKEQLFGCPKCDKKFRTEQMVADHLHVHSLNLYQCSICRIQLLTGSDLVQHLKTHTGDKPFQCSICGKRFTQPGSLSTHTRIHTGEKPHQCSKCEKCFTQASSLAVHLKIHSPIKPFWCEICDRSYSQQAYFNRHMRYHQQDKEDNLAQCPLCNVMIFDAKKNMVKHFNKFHYNKQDQSFLCSICNQGFDDPQVLIAHVKLHFKAENV